MRCQGYFLKIALGTRLPLEVFYEKGGFKNFAKFSGKYLWFLKFSRTPFLQNTSAAVTLLIWGTVNSIWKTSDKYFLSRNADLRSTLQVYLSR